MANMDINSTYLIGEGVRIPRLGFGVYKSPVETCTNSCLTALQVGYRHIDTAQIYGNEAEVGQALSQSGIPRSEVFITTKILSTTGSVEESYAECVESVNKLNPGAADEKDGYVDLFLIHSPNAGAGARRELWQALERLYKEGKAKSIGVSNFGIKHIEELKRYAQVWPPHVLQIELHPWCQQRQVVEYCQKNNIIVEAYCPIVRNLKAADETLVGISHKWRVGTSQVLIRYCLQKHWVPLPKSDNSGRIEQNANVYGFELDEEDMEALDGLDQGRSGAIVQAVDN